MLVTRVLTTVCCLTLCLIDSWSQYLLPITMNRKIVSHGVWQNTLVRSELVIHDTVQLQEVLQNYKPRDEKFAKHAFKYFQKKTT